MTRTKAFTPQRYAYISRDGREFTIVRGNSAHSRFYVLSPTGKYLTKGDSTLLDAQIAAEGL